jgi:cytochrome c biogenesis protein CcdA
MINSTFLPQMLLAQEVVQVSFKLNGILALLAGILILLIPRLLNYIVAIYLILVGLVQVFDLRI